MSQVLTSRCLDRAKFPENFPLFKRIEMTHMRFSLLSPELTLPCLGGVGGSFTPAVVIEKGVQLDRH